MDRFKAFAHMVRRRVEDKWDFVIAVDGREGSGKSTAALHFKALYDEKYNLDYVLFDADPLLDAMQTAPPGSCIVLDEAIISLYKREALKDFQVILAKAFSIVRARQLVFLIVLPNFFDLDSSIRTRANYRLYCYSKAGRRGYMKTYKPKRNEWSQGYLYHELQWTYIFPALPDSFQLIYDDWKMEGLTKTLARLERDHEAAVEVNLEKERWGRMGTKLAKMEAALRDDSNRPDGQPPISNGDLAAAAGSTIGYVKSNRYVVEAGIKDE